MSNHDLTIANGPGINVRQDIEAALEALGSTFQGSAAPLVSYPCQMWADSSAGLLKIRNVANTAWITLGLLDTANFGHMPLTGGTITGNLTVSGTTNVQALNSAAHSVTGTLSVSAAGNFATSVLAGASFYADGPAGAARALIGRTSGVLRWLVAVGTSTAESGANAGSDFLINRYNDAGGFLDSPISISRAGGGVTVAGNLFVNSNLTVTAALTGNTANFSGAITGQASVNAQASVTCTVPNGSNALYWSTVTGTRQWYAGCLQTGVFMIADQSAAAARLQIDTAGTVTVLQGLNVNGNFTWGGSATGGNTLALDGASAQGKALMFTTAGSLRWYYQSDAVAEGAGNSGSNFALNCYSNTGVSIGQVYNIVRATRVVTFSVAIVNPSDRRLKTDIAPLGDGLALIAAMRPVYYRKIGPLPERRQLGLVAQEVEAVLPEVVYETAERSDEGDAILGIDYVKLVPVLIGAVQALNDRIATLEGKARQ